MNYIAGIDEAGRGPLAGSVYAAAVILPESHSLIGLKDSKLLNENRREKLFDEILKQAIAYGIAYATVAEIEQYNILQASLIAMQRAVAQLKPVPNKIVVDGCHLPHTPYPGEAIVQGDKLVAAISAASILAKVSRDREMLKLDKQLPGYGFAQHKGYATKAHIAALNELGVSPIHRKTYAPVRARIEREKGEVQ